jgi:hypothetical protein
MFYFPSPAKKCDTQIFAESNGTTLATRRLDFWSFKRRLANQQQFRNKREFVNSAYGSAPFEWIAILRQHAICYATPNRDRIHRIVLREASQDGELRDERVTIHGRR